MTTPFPFVAGQVLTAAQLNSISELPTRTLTATGNAIAADRYSRVILDGSSISYTVNSATFDVGEVVHLYNINSTAATIAAGTGGVTINAAAGLTLAQYQAATLYAVSATSFILWKTDITQTAPGLELIKTQTVGNAVASVTVSDVFSATYDRYLITAAGGAQSAGGAAANLTLGATTTGYYWATNYATYTGASGVFNGANTTSWGECCFVTANGFSCSIVLTNPFASANTIMNSQNGGAVTSSFNISTNVNGYLANTTSYTAFTFTLNSGTVTGGTIRVYGFRN